MEQSVSCPRASRDAPLIPSKGSTVLVGAADPLELLRAGSTRKTPRHREPGRLWGDTACSEGCSAGGKKSCTLWGPKSLQFEPGEAVCSEGAFPLGFPREIRGGLELSGTPGQRHGRFSLPRELGAGQGDTEGGVGSGAGLFPNPRPGTPGAGHRSRSAFQLL